MTINITGKIIRGDGYGKVLGFPTANLDRREYVRQKMKVRLGIWAGQAKLKIKKLKIYRAGIIIGPVDKHYLPKIEAHLIGFKGNLYGKKITLILKKYLRPFKKYTNVADLKKQIKNDIVKIKQLTINS